MNSCEMTYYRLDDLSERLQVKPYLLQFWIKEFGLGSVDNQNPSMRLISSDELKKLASIKYLLLEQHLTVLEVRTKLDNGEFDMPGLGEADSSQEDFSVSSRASGWQVNRLREKDQIPSNTTFQDIKSDEFRQKLYFVRGKLSSLVNAMEEIKTFKNWN